MGGWMGGWEDSIHHALRCFLQPRCLLSRTLFPDCGDAALLEAVQLWRQQSAHQECELHACFGLSVLLTKCYSLVHLKSTKMYFLTVLEAGNPKISV